MPAARPDKILLRFALLGLAFAPTWGTLACGGKGNPAALAGRHGRPAVVTAPAVAIELRRWTAPREVVRVGLQGVVIGPEAGPLEWKAFVEPRRADEVWYFLGTYAPFTGKAGAEEIAFHGRGRTKAGAAEQRMILEWTRQMAAESAAESAAAAVGGWGMPPTGWPSPGIREGRRGSARTSPSRCRERPWRRAAAGRRRSAAGSIRRRSPGSTPGSTG